MFIAAIICFALAIVGGIILAVGHRGEYRPPTWLAVGHGLAAGAGVILLFIIYFTTPEVLGTGGTTSLGIFLLAALGGIYLFTRRFSSSRTPLGIIFLHGGLALTAFLILVLASGT